MLFVNNKEVCINHFPDGTQHINLLCSDYCKNQAFITWKYDDDSEFLSLAYLVGHLRSKGMEKITLHLPYIPNARFDRVKNEDEVFTLKYFAGLVNNLKFDHITAVDPHSHVSEALFDNFEAVSPTAQIKKALTFAEEQSENKKTMLFFPDEGAMKRYSENARTNGIPFCFGIKNRDWKTGTIQGLSLAGDIEMIKDRTILIVDDICSKGGTFYHSAKKLKEYGAGKIFLYISHCENTILEGELINSGLIEKIYTTDSIYRTEHPLIEVIG